MLTATALPSVTAFFIIVNSMFKKDSRGKIKFCHCRNVFKNHAIKNAPVKPKTKLPA